MEATSENGTVGPTRKVHPLTAFDAMDALDRTAKDGWHPIWLRDAVPPNQED